MLRDVRLGVAISNGSTDDVVTATAAGHRRRRFDADDLDAIRRSWHERLTAFDELPGSWALDPLADDEHDTIATKEEP